MGEKLYPKLEELVEKMKRTGQFAEPLLTPSRLQRQVLAGRAVLRPNQPMLCCTAPGPIIAHVARRKTRDPLWQEVAQIWVDPEHQGNGLMSEIVAELIGKTPKSVRLFGITKVQSVMDLFMRSYLVPVTKCIVPEIEDWAAKVGLGDRLPETALRWTPTNPTEGERWLFMEVRVQR